LGTSRESSEKSVVRFLGNKRGKVIFQKDKASPWLSRKNVYENSLTSEGDIRISIFLFGPKLAEELGFNIRDLGNGVLEIEVPNSQMLATLVSRINLGLLSRGLEPITYLPVRAGFVSSEESLQLTLSSREGLLMLFPYADLDPKLVSHEVAFHLGSILLPRQMTSRARSVTLETVRFVEFLRKNQGVLGDKAVLIAEQLMHERNFELDNGTATLTATPAFTRRNEGLPTYKQLIEKFDETAWKYMTKAVEYLARPGIQPLDALLFRLQYMVGLNVNDFAKSNPSEFKVANSQRHNLGTKIELDIRELEILRKLLTTYVQQPRPQYETISARNVLDNYLQNLDGRIEDILGLFP
jgi:hypothetical protein